MGKYRSYQVDEKSNENDEITFDIVSVEENRPYSLTCRACDGDIEIGFTLREKPGSGEPEFKSDGEVTINFIKLLARLFEKDFEVKNVVDAIRFHGFWIEDIIDGTFLDKDGKFYVTCTFGTEEEKANRLYMLEMGDFFSETEEANSQELSPEEIAVKQKEFLKKNRVALRKSIEASNYAEVYVHIDMQNRQLGFAMINPAYQLPILRLLTGTPSIAE